MATMNLGRIAYVNKQAYVAATSYSKMDVVSHNGSSWASLVDNNVGHTPAEGTYWTLMASGLSPDDKAKLNGIEASANKYVHPAYTAKASGLYKITVDATGHISAVTAATKADITALGIPAQDTNTTYLPATAAVDGLMSKADKTKLDGVAASANNYIHPAYTAKASGLYKITVDATGHISTVTAATKADITALGIPAQDTVYIHPVGAGNTHIPTGGAAGQFLKWSAAGAAVWAADNNTTYGIATTAVDGLMSKADKARLDKAVVPNDIGTVSLGALPITKYSLKYTYTSATPIAISFAATPAEGQEFMLDILNSTAADITQPIPNAAAWQCDDTSVVLPAGKVTGISIRYVHEKYCVRF